LQKEGETQNNTQTENRKRDTRKAPEKLNASLGGNMSFITITRGPH